MILNLWLKEHWWTETVSPIHDCFAKMIYFVQPLTDCVKFGLLKLSVNVVFGCSDVPLFSNKGNHSVNKSIPVLLLKRCKQKKPPLFSEKKSHGSLGLSNTVVRCSCILYNLSHTVSSLCYKTRAKNMLSCCDIYASAITTVTEYSVYTEVWDLKVCGCTKLAMKLFCGGFFPCCQVSFKELQTS